MCIEDQVIIIKVVACRILKIHSLPAVDTLALVSMTNAAKRERQCDARHTVSHQLFERTRHIFFYYETMCARLSAVLNVILQINISIMSHRCMVFNAKCFFFFLFSSSSRYYLGNTPKTTCFQYGDTRHWLFQFLLLLFLFFFFSSMFSYLFLELVLYRCRFIVN